MAGRSPSNHEFVGSNSVRKYVFLIAGSDLHLLLVPNNLWKDLLDPGGARHDSPWPLLVHPVLLGLAGQTRPHHHHHYCLQRQAG